VTILASHPEVEFILNSVSDDVIGCRDKAIIALSMYALMIQPEVSLFKVGDFRRDEHGYSLVFRRRSVDVGVRLRDDVALRLVEYLEKAGIEGQYDLPLFRPKRQSNNTHPLVLSGCQLSRITTRRSREASVLVGRRFVHKLRSGVVQASITSGVNPNSVAVALQLPADDIRCYVDESKIEVDDRLIPSALLDLRGKMPDFVEAAGELAVNETAKFIRRQRAGWTRMKRARMIVSFWGWCSQISRVFEGFCRDDIEQYLGVLVRSKKGHTVNATRYLLTSLLNWYESTGVLGSPTVETIEAARSIVGGIPALISAEGGQAVKIFKDFFVPEDASSHTLTMRAHEVVCFVNWCEEKSIAKLSQLRFSDIKSYGEEVILSRRSSGATRVSILRGFFDRFVVGGVLNATPMPSCNWIKFQRSKIADPLSRTLKLEQVNDLFEAMDRKNLKGLRDSVIFGLMLYAFARRASVARLNAGDYFCRGGRKWLKLSYRASSYEVPVHPQLEEWLDGYLEVVPLSTGPEDPLLRRMASHSCDHMQSRRLGDSSVTLLAKVYREKLDLPDWFTAESVRATGMVALIDSGVLSERLSALFGLERLTPSIRDRLNVNIRGDELDGLIYDDQTDSPTSLQDFAEKQGLFTLDSELYPENE